MSSPGVPLALKVGFALCTLGLIAAVWLWDWRWAATGVLVLLASAVVGTTRRDGAP